VVCVLGVALVIKGENGQTMLPRQRLEHVARPRNQAVAGNDPAVDGNDPSIRARW
jgi:hypothetical protein